MCGGLFRVRLTVVLFLRGCRCVCVLFVGCARENLLLSEMNCDRDANVSFLVRGRGVVGGYVCHNDHAVGLFRAPFLHRSDCCDLFGIDDDFDLFVQHLLHHPPVRRIISSLHFDWDWDCECGYDGVGNGEIVDSVCLALAAFPVDEMIVLRIQLTGSEFVGHVHLRIARRISLHDENVGVVLVCVHGRLRSRRSFGSGDVDDAWWNLRVNANGTYSLSAREI